MRKKKKNDQPWNFVHKKTNRQNKLGKHLIAIIVIIIINYYYLIKL